MLAATSPEWALSSRRDHHAGSDDAAGYTTGNGDATRPEMTIAAAACHCDLVGRAGRGAVTPSSDCHGNFGKLKVKLVLSLFPGIDLLGRGFEAEGYCVVRGPDLLWGGDIREFHPPSGKFNGIIAGSPCQDFSKARRSPPSGYGNEMLAEFARVVTEAFPDWWLLENVPTVPRIQVAGYSVQRLDLNAREGGMRQRRRSRLLLGAA